MTTADMAMAMNRLRRRRVSKIVKTPSWCEKFMFAVEAV